MSVGDEFEKLVIAGTPPYFKRLKDKKIFFKNGLIKLSPDQKGIIELLNDISTKTIKVPDMLSGKNPWTITSGYRNGGDHTASALDLSFNRPKMYELYLHIATLIDEGSFRDKPNKYGLYLGYHDPAIPPLAQAMQHIHLVCNGNLGKREGIGFEKVNLSPGNERAKGKEDQERQDQAYASRLVPKSQRFPERLPTYKNPTPASVDNYNKILELARKDMSGDSSPVSISGFNFGNSNGAASTATPQINNKYLTMANDAYTKVMDTVFN